MRESPKSKPTRPDPTVDRSVGSLASRALSVLASRRGEKTNELSERYLMALQRSVCGKDLAARDQVVREMVTAKISQVDIADFYIPEVARRMGLAWADDGMSFADVTIATARLQGLLRDLTERWSVDKRMYDDGLNIVVLMLADDYHTLGPTLITSQLRRLGASVRLMLGRPIGEIKQLLRDQQFDAIMVSVSHVEKLAGTGELVKIIRNNLTDTTPIVVGGPAVTLFEDAQSITGADLITNDVKEALQTFNLMNRTHSPPTPAPEA